ncbi:MAG: circularly permuted type 2 ATP-grasp protein [Pseudomonadota bacterium]|nr:circularly permuted type 2 ATP-grasp protein [Pseudomonadota bacterium]
MPTAGSFDEMRDPAGELRSHWQYLLGAVHALGPRGIEERRREARRLIRDNGVTYNVYGDAQGISRPWNLDLIPLLVRSDEWAVIERGLMQRAELLNQVLLDLYGPRDLIRKGLLPAELIDAYAGYLLPCHGIRVAGDRPLVHYAADLTRAADGSWCVVGDRAQNPSGAGYALENRMVLSHVLPSLFRDSHVHRWAGFFRSMRRTLTRLAPRRDDHARVAVLTPGRSNEAHFEHAYLANYLGYNLVQGGDLSVRDGALWLRTLGRLEPIHVVLRRVDDGWCDPLELQEDSLLGVPGLVQAARNGKVTLANALGSGVLEHPGLAAFLPTLCQQLLGEDPLLAGIPTYWCGDPRNLEFVLDNLVNLVLKPVSGPSSGQRLVGNKMEAAELAKLVDEIRSEPRHYVARAQINPSTSPALIGGRFEPRPTVLRSFLVSEEDGYAVIPGGLSRLGLSSETPVVSHQLGGIAKDTWVLASEPERQESLIVSTDHAAPAVVRESEVSSRVADNLFWIGRYAERAEGLVRLLRISIFKLSERASFWLNDDGAGCVKSLLEAVTHENMTRNEGWHFLEAGRRLERGSSLATLLQTTLVPVSAENEETMLVEAVLGVTDSLITYRRRYQGGTRIGALLDLVFQDESNPRSLAYQLVTLERLVGEMPRMELAGGRTQAEKLVLKGLTEVRLAEIDPLVRPDGEGRLREALDAMLETVGTELAAISNALTAQYFAHEEQPHSLLSPAERVAP